MTSPGWVLSPHEFGPAERDFQHRLSVKTVVTVLDINHRGSSCCWWNQFCPAVRACTMFTQPSVQTLGVEELWTAPRWYWKNVSAVGSLINILATPISPHPPSPGKTYWKANGTFVSFVVIVWSLSIALLIDSLFFRHDHSICNHSLTIYIWTMLS